MTLDEQAAQQHFTQGRLPEATAAFELLSEQLLERLDLQARLGDLALLANDLEAAINHLSQAIDYRLRSRKTLAHLAEADSRKGRLHSAAYCYQRLGREGLAGTLAVMSKLDAWQIAQASICSAIPWLTAKPHIVINVEVNGHSTNRVVDTGAGDTLLDWQRKLARTRTAHPLATTGSILPLRSGWRYAGLLPSRA